MGYPYHHQGGMYPPGYYGHPSMWAGGRDSAPTYQGYGAHPSNRPHSAFMYGRHYSYGGREEEEEETSPERSPTDSEEEYGSERSSQLEIEEAERNRYDMEEKRRRYFWDMERRQYFQKLPLAPHLQGLLWKNPPDEDYWELLNPAEASAFHYYYAMNGYWPEIDAFQEMYRIRMEKFRLENYYNEQAAWFCLVSEIRFNAQRAREKKEAEEKKRRAAYAAGRRSMFSDDREDSLQSGSRPVVHSSEDTDREVQSIVSGGQFIAKYSTAAKQPHANYNKAKTKRRVQESDRSFDMQSEVSGPVSREPLKFKRPHAFVRFGPGGKIVTFHPSQESLRASYHQKNSGVGGTLEIRDVKSFIHERLTAEHIRALNNFPGPLIPRETPGREVIHFCLQQVEIFRRERRWDAVLVWRLLDVLVRQEGRICGADLAELLLEGAKDREVPPEPNFDGDETNDWPGDGLTLAQEEEAMNTFRKFLLLGRKRDAVVWAAQNRLWGHAFYFARTLGERDFMDISARFLDSMKQEDSVYTVAAVHLGRTPMPTVRSAQNEAGNEEDGASPQGRDWREHLAILLGNFAEVHSGATALTPEQEEFNTNVMLTVYALGQKLAEDDRFWAAHFCLLSAHLLAGWDVFQPLQVPRGMAVPYHVTLIGRSSDSGFSLLECQCTEVYEFAYRLRHGDHFVIPSLKQHLFAQMKSLAEFGFPDRAYTYARQIHSAITINPTFCTSEMASDLYEMGNRLSVAASGVAHGDFQWLRNLWEMAQKLAQGQSLVPVPQPEQEPEPVTRSGSYGTAGARVTEEDLRLESDFGRRDYEDSWRNSERRPSESFSSRHSAAYPVQQSEVSSRRDSLVPSMVGGQEGGNLRSPVHRLRSDSQRSTSSTVRSGGVDRHSVHLSADYEQPPSPKSPASTAESEGRDQFFTPAAPNIYHQPPSGYAPRGPPAMSPGSDNVFSSPESGTPLAPTNHQVNWLMGDNSLTGEHGPESEGGGVMDGGRGQEVGDGRGSRLETEEQRKDGIDTTPKSGGDKGGLSSGKRNQSWIMTVAQKLIPTPKGTNEMKLPTDEDKSIWWNAEKKCYEGPGVEVREAPPPPPMDIPVTSDPVPAPVAAPSEPRMTGQQPPDVQEREREADNMFVSESTSSMMGVQTLENQTQAQEPPAPRPTNRFARGTRGSRYVNVLDPNKPMGDSGGGGGPVSMAPPVPNTFFMPVAPVENGVEEVNPFSVPEDPNSDQQPPPVSAAESQAHS